MVLLDTFFALQQIEFRERKKDCVTFHHKAIQSNLCFWSPRSCLSVSDLKTQLQAILSIYYKIYRKNVFSRLTQYQKHNIFVRDVHFPYKFLNLNNFKIGVGG